MTDIHAALAAATAQREARQALEAGWEKLARDLKAARDAREINAIEYRLALAALADATCPLRVLAAGTGSTTGNMSQLIIRARADVAKAA